MPLHHSVASSGSLHNSGHSHSSTLAGAGRMKTNCKANWERGVPISAFAADIFNIKVCSDELHDELTSSVSVAYFIKVFKLHISHFPPLPEVCLSIK